MRPRLGRLTLFQRERLTGFFGWFIDIARGAALRPRRPAGLACQTAVGSSCVIRVSEGAAKSNSFIHGSRWSWVSKRASLACGASRCRVVLTFAFQGLHDERADLRTGCRSGGQPLVDVLLAAGRRAALMLFVQPVRNLVVSSISYRAECVSPWELWPETEVRRRRCR